MHCKILKLYLKLGAHCRSDQLDQGRSGQIEPSGNFADSLVKNVLSSPPGWHRFDFLPEIFCQKNRVL